MDLIGDVAVLRAQLADGQANARLWIAVAESNEECVYVRRMQASLGDLERILDRIERRETSDEWKRWEENVKAFLEAFRGAGNVRGCIVGTGLSPLAARLGNQAEEKNPLSWEDIEITFLSEHRVAIQSGGNGQTTYNYDELGFADGRDGKPSLAWVMLRELAKRGGDIPRPPAGNPRVSGQKRIEEIREKLRSHFKIEGDPIPFNGNMYKASFKLGFRQSFDT